MTLAGLVLSGALLGVIIADLTSRRPAPLRPAVAAALTAAVGTIATVVAVNDGATTADVAWAVAYVAATAFWLWEVHGQHRRAVSRAQLELLARHGTELEQIRHALCLHLLTTLTEETS